jgi:ADP-heptose:LPS heptosyltransferase
LWEGGEWNLARNVPLGELEVLLENPAVEFYSFQRGPGRAELLSHRLGRRIRDLSGESPHVVHFAADLLNMDLLITVDTMAAHLAGALGKAVWVLLPYEADWRWMLDRCDTPWYPTMRLFRQRVRQDWRWPVQQVIEELETFARSCESG